MRGLASTLFQPHLGILSHRSGGQIQLDNPEARGYTDMRNHKIIVRTGKHGHTRIYHIPETPRSYLYSYKPEYIAPTITDLGTIDKLII